MMNDAVRKSEPDSFLGVEPGVLDGFLIDLLQGLSGMPGQDPAGLLPDLQEASADFLDLQGVSPHPIGDKRVMDHHPAMRQNITLFAGREKKSAHAGGRSHTDGANWAGESLHYVIQGQPAGDLTAGAVDVHGDLAAGIFLLEIPQLAAQGIYGIAVDFPNAFQFPALQHFILDGAEIEAAAGFMDDPGFIGVHIITSIS